MFFKREPVNLFADRFRKILKEIELFIPLVEVDSVTQYVIGPINRTNYFDLKSFLLKYKPLTTFEIYGNDFLTIYRVKSTSDIDLFFATRNSENYEQTVGFYSLVKDAPPLDDYLSTINYFVLYKNGIVYTSGKEVVNKEYIFSSSEEFIP
jgi:hypothetical protein